MTEPGNEPASNGAGSVAASSAGIHIDLRRFRNKTEKVNPGAI